MIVEMPAAARSSVRIGSATSFGSGMVSADTSGAGKVEPAPNNVLIAPPHQSDQGGVAACEVFAKVRTRRRACHSRPPSTRPSNTTPSAASRRRSTSWPPPTPVIKRDGCALHPLIDGPVSIPEREIPPDTILAAISARRALVRHSPTGIRAGRPSKAPLRSGNPNCLSRRQAPRREARARDFDTGWNAIARLCDTRSGRAAGI